MQTYIFLTRWTDQGVRDATGSVERASEAVEAMEELGVKIFETYWTVGAYDLVLVAECPDQETAHAVSLKLGRRGNVRATALRAWDRAEMTGILTKLG